MAIYFIYQSSTLDLFCRTVCVQYSATSFVNGFVLYMYTCTYSRTVLVNHTVYNTVHTYSILWIHRYCTVYAVGYSTVLYLIALTLLYQTCPRLIMKLKFLHMVLWVSFPSKWRVCIPYSVNHTSYKYVKFVTYKHGFMDRPVCVYPVYLHALSVYVNVNMCTINPSVSLKMSLSDDA